MTRLKIKGKSFILIIYSRENPSTKRRLHGLLMTSGLIDHLIPIRARQATKYEILRFHTPEYHDRIVAESKLSKGGDGGEQCRSVVNCQNYCARYYIYVTVCIYVFLVFMLADMISPYLL